MPSERNMDYIRKRIDRRIKFLSNSGGSAELRLYYQVRLEYLLLYALGYLWNKNIDHIDAHAKEYVYSKIYKPTIGTIVDLCRKLDIGREIFANKHVSAAFERYPKVRNELIGHGYV